MWDKKSFRALFAVMAVLAVFLAFMPKAYGKEASLFVSPYISCEKTGADTGSWKMDLPVAKLLEPHADLIKRLGDTGAYPHGRDGKNKIAYIRYNIVFPEGVTPDISGITITNACSFINGKAITYELEGQTIKVKIPLNDVNWASIYKLYEKDIADPDSHLLSCLVPYSINSSGANLSEIESFGDFAFYPSGFNAALGIGLTEFTTDDAYVSVMGGAASTDSHEITWPDSFDLGTLDLAGYGSVEGKKKVVGGAFDGRYPYDPKAVSFTVAAHLNNEKVKQSLTQMMSMTSVSADKIGLSEVVGIFTCEFDLGNLKLLPDTSYVLAGDNGVYSVVDHQVMQKDGHNFLKVTMQLNNPEKIKTLQDLNQVLNKANDELKLTFDVLTPQQNLVDMTGSFNGEFQARASLIDYPGVDGIPFVMKYVSDGTVKLFKPIVANFMADVADHGSVSVGSVVLAPDTDHGPDFTPTSKATAAKGYRFVNWTHDGKVISKDSELKLHLNPGETMWYGHEGDYIAHFEKILMGEVIVHYVDEAGNTIKDDVVDTPKQEIGGSYDTADLRPQTIKFAGNTYQLVIDKTEGSETGIVVEGVTEVTYVYRKVVDTPSQIISSDNGSTPIKPGKTQSLAFIAPNTSDPGSYIAMVFVAVVGSAFVFVSKRQA